MIRKVIGGRLSKKGQEATLALRIGRAFFKVLLVQAVQYVALAQDPVAARPGATGSC